MKLLKMLMTKLKRIECEHGSATIVRIDRWHPFEDETCFAKILHCPTCNKEWSQSICCVEAHALEAAGVVIKQDDSRTYCGIVEGNFGLFRKQI